MPERLATTLLLASLIPIPILMLAACTAPAADVGGQDTPQAQPVIPQDEPVTTGEAPVESIEILIMESFPVQVSVLAKGNLPDGCTEIDQVNRGEDLETYTLWVEITTIRPTDEACTEALVPFEETVSLDVYGLPAGTYTVDVNGIIGTFTLSVDNAPQEGEQEGGNSGGADESPESWPRIEGPSAALSEPVPGPEPASEPGTISGVVWEDYCILVCTPSGEGRPSGGCVEDDVDGYRADGIHDAGESRLPGMRVTLSAGPCPGSEVLASATTDDGGAYAFTDLPAATYCVAIDPLDEQNFSLLMPGAWTFPEVDVGHVTVTLDEDEARTDVDFGWDPQFR